MSKKEQAGMLVNLVRSFVKDLMTEELSKLMLAVGLVTATVILSGLGVVALWEILLK